MTPSPHAIIGPLLEFVSIELLHGEQDLDEQTPLLALGVIDSLSMVSLLDFIQRTFHVVVPNDSVTVENFEDVSAIAELVCERMGIDVQDADISERSPMEQAVYVLEAAGVASEHHRLPGGQVLHLLTVDGEFGPPWVMVPGLGNPASSFGNMLKALDGDHPAAALDLAGFGLSTGEHEPHYSDHVRDLEQLLEQRFGDTRVVLIGSSAGCLVTLDYARRHPQRVAALVLVGFGLIADPHAWMAELDQLWAQPEEFLARTYHQPPRLNELLLGQFRAIYAMDAYHSYLRPEDLDPTIFDGIEVPTLIVGGSSDRIIGIEAIRAAAKRLRRAELVELARCGHFPASERPEETIYTIDSFLQNQGLR